MTEGEYFRQFGNSTYAPKNRIYFIIILLLLLFVYYYLVNWKTKIWTSGVNYSFNKHILTDINLHIKTYTYEETV